MTLRDLVESVCRRATVHTRYEFPCVTLTQARERTVDSHRIRISARLTSNGVGHDLEVIDSYDNSWPQDLGRLIGVSSAIHQIAFGKTTYRKAKEDYIFRTLYNVAERTFTYMTAQGEVAVPNVDSMPCQICGIILPVDKMTVDHQRPQSGGGLEATAKTFRAFGLTIEPPKGPKGRLIQAHVFDGASARLSAVPTKLGRVPLVESSANSRDNRYTLNTEGMILYSFVAAAGGSAELKNACLHGLMNLRPACGRCNSLRGQQLKYIDES